MSKIPKRKYWTTADQEWKAIKNHDTSVFWLMLIFLISGTLYVIALIRGGAK